MSVLWGWDEFVGNGLLSSTDIDDWHIPAFAIIYSI